MSRLRQSFLEIIRTLGNESGCHQMPERSFFYKDKQFPVCARCTGVFIGHSLAVVLFFMKKQISFRKCCILMGIMGADWCIQEVGLEESTNGRRLITGFLGGLGLFSIYSIIIRKAISLLSGKSLQ
ncbi:putative membrane protein [Kineothrix alysoides]|uniref:Putative membrane protein n=1 Tax=Kineothrix alysoides TaxID=1469948 RepID=A0A4R1QWN0_9FIRM|nr:DUF2085 domain-containing protein [Kineothrix alysoides]TCL57255.1 putative membrane protein [Kineothrix alysoides]